MSVSAATYKRDVRTALRSFLAAYFDGAAHNFTNDAGATTAVTFPLCTLVFDRPQWGAALSVPHIVLLPIGSDRERNREPTKRGQRVLKEVVYRIEVWTTNVNKLWDTNDNVQDKLGLAFNGSHVLDLAGLRTLKLGDAAPLNADPSQEWQLSARAVTFLVEVLYPGAG